MTASGTYKETVNLPKTQFDMRANAVKREPELQKFWADQQIYQKLSQGNPGELFVLHDGPPYANGSLHIGHALNKILKDIINKFQLLQGRKVQYVPGWDCHGLPIELKVLQAMSAEERQQLTPLTLRHKARDFALKAVDQQRAGFKRYGIWGDWDHPYLTLTPAYEAAQIAVFGQMVLKGYIYRGLKPVHWSPSSKTALAEAELEYPEGHTSRSIYAAFPMVNLAAGVRSQLEPYLPDLKVAIWTTTPWTIPANLAVSVNPNLTYAVVEVGEDFQSAGSEAASSLPKVKYLLVAAELVERLSAVLGTNLTVQATVKGQELEHSTYRHPLFERESPIVIGGDYVTTESGTGLVHTAPGHGQDDYLVGQRYGLPILAPVDEDGNFTAEVSPFDGLNVLGEGNTAIIEALADVGALLKEEPYVHKYPYDWRTKKPTIFRATEQWFASVEGFRDEALKAIASVTWIPAQGENRITAMVEDRSDWCISRQRSWGVPIPVFYDEETGEPLLNEETIAHVQTIIAQQGSDAWWELSTEELLPESYRHNGRTYRRGTDTMDVWFDSGSSWAAVLARDESSEMSTELAQTSKLKYPADMYLEGSDQHRGWFQSSLLTSVATHDCAPYKTVLTHGFTLDEQGRKMSKSVGNVIDPAIVIEGGKNQKEEPAYGADVLRLWVSSVDYSTDVPISKNILKQLSDVYRKIRNTARFLLGNLHDFDPAQHAVPYEQLPELDRYMLHRMTEVFGEITEAFESFQFFRFFQTVQNFCVVDLSNFYLDIAKDRLYISAPDAFRRRSCQTVLAIALENLAKAIAPVLCHMAEDIWQYLPYTTPYQSVFEAGWVQLEDQWHQPELASTWKEIRRVRAEVNKVMEQARAEKAIGSSLEAKLLLYVPDAELQHKLEALHPNPQPEAIAQTQATSELPEPEPPELELEVKPELEPEPKTDNLNEGILSGSAPTPAAKPNASPTATRVERSVKAWQQMWVEILRPFAKLPSNLSQVVSEYRGLLVITLLLAIAVLPLSVGSAVVRAINEIPLLAPTFELIGFWVTWRFVNRYLLSAKSRQELVEQIQSLIAQVQNSSDSSQVIVTPPPAINQGEVSHQEQAVSNLPDPAPETDDHEHPTPLPPATVSNGVDELRYLFLASQVELLDSPETLQSAEYSSQSDGLGVGVVNAAGQKCDRCWNYSIHVGELAEHPLLCERCIPALAGEF